MRNIKIDLSRGLLMVYIIVVIHGVFWLGIIPRPYSTIFLLEMPLIFLVSGYTYGLTSKKYAEINLPYYWKYFRARLSRILLPYFAYAIVCIALVIYMEESNNVLDIVLSWINPLSYGTGNSFSNLNWHLWFIPPFLLVTLLMPICKIDFFTKIPTSYALVLLFLLFLFFNFYYTSYSTYVFYFFWAYIGFKLSIDLKFSIKHLFIIGSSAFLILCLSKIVFDINLDMQTNKFPPNIIFLLFSIIWTSLIMIISKKIPTSLVTHNSNNYIIGLFISYGYSLYLWQGLGYAIARYVKNNYLSDTDLSWLMQLITWGIAIVLTIIFGVLASPIEKIRWRQTSKPSQ